MLFKIIVAHIFTRRVQRQVDLAVTFRLNGFLPELPGAVDGIDWALDVVVDVVAGMLVRVLEI